MIPTLLPAQSQTAQSGPHVVGHATAISERGASLTFELSDGTRRTVSLAGGNVVIDGDAVTGYTRGGRLESAWLRLVGQGGTLDAVELLAAAQAWSVEELSGAEAEASAVVRTALGSLTAPSGGPVSPPPMDPVVAVAPDVNVIMPGVPAPPGAATPERVRAQLDEMRAQLERGKLALGEARVTVGDLTVARGEVIEGNVAVLRGDITVEGRVTGNVVALDGEVLLRDGGEVDGDVLAMSGNVVRAGGVVHGTIRSFAGAEPATAREFVRPRARPSRSIVGDVGADVAGLVASFVALAAIGFGLVLVAPTQLEIVADTVRGSFWRSFLTGVLAQSLILPLFAVLMIGLVLTVVGILLLPFAAIALLAITALAVLAGYLATARSVGELYSRRRMALGHAMKGWLPWRYTLYGLAILMAVWAPAVLLGWVPVAGSIVSVSAAVFTWVMMTAGFGATILSRAGIRGTFARRFDQALSDQYLYVTADATPVVRLPPHDS